MSTPAIEILEAGLLTTVQDKGRYGYQRFGMPVAGAMDVFALRVGNALVGNDDGAAGLEMTVLGPKIRFLANTWIAVTGANLGATLDSEPMAVWQSVEVAKGSEVAFKGPEDGMRAYLAIAGGIDVPVVMGSRSTYLKAVIGGLEGRGLRPGDVLNTSDSRSAFLSRMAPDIMAQAYGSEHEVRVVFGPQYGRFTQAGIDVFLGSPYKVAIQSDRMGYRLEGPVIEHGDGPDVISDGTSFGAVQVPGDGQPIVLLADRGTTGGYTKIATVINSDLYKFAQAMPGQTMSFKSVSIEEAHEIYRIRESLLDEIRAEPPIETEDKAVRLEISVGGRAIELVDEGGDDIPIPSWARDAGAAGQFKGSASIKGETFEFDVTIQEID
jgi:antagonist of KipI